MKHRAQRLSNIAIYLIMAVITARAQMPDTVLPHSLEDAKRTAFVHNWTLLAAQAGISAATAGLLVAKEFPNPTLALTTTKVSDQNNRGAMGNGYWQRRYDSTAVVSQLFEIGGKRHARQISARAGIVGAKARFFDARRVLDQGVTKAFATALLADENARNLSESAGYMRHQADIANHQHQAGDISDADLSTLQINADQFQSQASAATAAAVQARVALEILMGVDVPRGSWIPAGSLDILANAAAQHRATNEASFAMRPDVYAAQSDVRASEANLKLQRAQRIPDPTISVGAEHDPFDGPPATDSMNFGISFPLPLWNRNRGNIQAAQATLTQSQLTLAQLKAQAAADLANAQAAFAEASGRWQRYRDFTAPASAKVRAAAEFKHEKGGATLLDLLNAEQTDNTIRLSLAQSMNDTISTAADLDAARTTLSETELSSLR